MRIRDPITDSEEPYNLVPLTDMVFNLLIFFLCATTFAQVEKEMSLDLPKAGLTKHLGNSSTDERLIINITKDGKAKISGKVFEPKALAEYVRSAVRKKKQAAIVRADEQSPLKYFAEVAKICVESGVTEVKLVYVSTN